MTNDLREDISSQRLLSSSHHYHSHSGNYSFTTSVTIRVTPHEDYLVSWGILWGGFILASLVAACQVHKEQKIIAAHRQADDVEQASGAAGDVEGVSTADITRGMFRQLLLLAMVARVILMPCQIWPDPMWWQFFSDTFPEMVFASAWTLLVTFFVQLVGIATGTGTNTSPGIVIQATAYVVYIVLITTQIWNPVSTVLLYALLCCIYAALFGTVMYFGPCLLTILRPSLARHGGLAIRLSICLFLCIVVFSAHTVGYARLIVAHPKDVYWWWKYGILELLPASIFLVIMHPSSQNKAGREVSPFASERGDTPPVPGTAHKTTIRRVESTSSANSGIPRVQQETSSLLKPAVVYGATAD